MVISNLNISQSTLKRVQNLSSKEYTLNNNDLIIFSVYLPNFSEIQDELSLFLSSKEIKKSERFYKDVDRSRFVIYRSILKFMLAAYTKLDVKNINLSLDFNKKPYLASHPYLFFNISHSEDYAVIAISNKKIGIDIEYMSEDFKYTELLPDIFDNNEIVSIENSANTKETFYTLWTRKEAFVKALGKGIDEDFKYIPCLEGKHTVDYDLLKSDQDWEVVSFDLTNKYVGSIAFESNSIIPKNLLLHTIPNTMKELSEMAQKING